MQTPNCSKTKNIRATKVCSQIVTAKHKNNFLSKPHIGLAYQTLLSTWIYVLNTDKNAKMKAMDGSSNGYIASSFAYNCVVFLAFWAPQLKKSNQKHLHLTTGSGYHLTCSFYYLFSKINKPQRFFCRVLIKSGLRGLF